MEKSETFDEIYPMKEGYERFDGRNTAFSLKQRRTGGQAFSYMNEKPDKIKSGMPGFSLLDYAFKEAAETYTDHGTNTGYYSWSPLGVTSKPEGIPKWDVSPERASKVVRKAAKFYGAVNAGFCMLDKRWVYSHTSDGRPIVFEDVEQGYITDEKLVIPNSHKYVIALTVPMEFIENSYAPTNIEVTSNMGYSRMHVLAGTVAEFIRGLGWNAIPCGNDVSLSVPTAIQAGLGHMGRMGRLITWERGPLVRICKVYTDLPLAPSPPAPKGIIEFCEVCEKCARLCPSQSIPYGPRTWESEHDSVTNNNGIYKWYTNEETCFDYWHEVGTGCSICFRCCDFTHDKGILHEIVKWFIRNVPQLNRFFVWTDELLGYGKISDAKTYWDKPYKPS